MLECQLEKLFTEANLQKTTKESSYYSPVTEHWAEFPLHFSQLQVLSCCTLNSIEKVLRSSRSILYIKHYEIQSYLYELIHVFQHTKIASVPSLSEYPMILLCFQCQYTYMYCLDLSMYSVLSIL